VIDRWQKRLEQCVDTDDSILKAPLTLVCLKFKFLFDMTASCFQSRPILAGNHYNFDEVNIFCISQGSAVTLFWCGGQVYNNYCQFFCARVINIGSFLTRAVQKIMGHSV